MEASDAADMIQEAAEEHEAESAAWRAQREAEHRRVDHFRRRAALLVASLAALLAIASMGGQNATKETIDANIQASDTFAFFQAKNIRQTSNQLAADELESLLAVTNPSEAARSAIQQRIDRYKATVARYESEPETGEGKKELQLKAQGYVKDRDHAQEQDPNFDFSEALFQIAIVLGSLAIVAVSRPVLLVAMGVGGVALVLMLNGFFLWFHLPIG
jgi:hypothetical protein